MESLMAGFVQLLCTIAKFLFFECLHSSLIFSWTSLFPTIQSNFSTCDDNNLAPFHLAWILTMIKQKKTLGYSLRVCLEIFFCLLSH